MSVIWSGVTEEGAVVPVQVTAEGKVVAVGDGPEGEFLKLTGGNLTGDLTLGTDKITLDATDGRGTFGNYGTSTDAARVLGGSGFSYRGDTSVRAIQIFKNGYTSADRTVLINTDGSADFTGTVNVGGSLQVNGAPQVSNSSLSIAGSAYIYSTPATNAGLTLKDDGNNKDYLSCRNAANTEVIEFDVNGAATFAGGTCGFTSSGEMFFTSRNARYKLVVSNGLCTAEPYTRQMEVKEKAEQLIADKRETKPSEPSDPQPEVTSDNDNA